MDKNRVIWWIIGGATMGIMGYVLYLFVIAPLPESLQPKHHIEAEVQLKRVCELQKGYFETRHTYAASLDSLGVYQSENDGGKYWLEMEKADSTTMIVRAYARLDFDQDGNQNVWEIGLDCNPRELQAD